MGNGRGGSIDRYTERDLRNRYIGFCPVCGKGFSDLENLSGHCETCGNVMSHNNMDEIESDQLN